MPEALPQLIAIAAMASNRVIGREGKLPWHVPEDLKFFKETTLHHPVLMGRVTYESIVAALGKPLPKRRNIVLSRTLPPQEGIEVIQDLSELGSLPALGSPVFLIGGAQLYEELLPQCAGIYLTYLHQAYQGDAFFPPFENEFSLDKVVREGPGFEIRWYLRKTPNPT